MTELPLATLILFHVAAIIVGYSLAALAYLTIVHFRRKK